MSPRASDRDPNLDTKDTEDTPTAIPDGHDSDWIRVQDPDTGDHYTTTRALAARAGAKHLPDRAAVDQYGQPLPRKPKNTKES